MTKVELVGARKGDGPFTVRAPTDEAFAAALEALDVTAEELLARDDLADILKEPTSWKTQEVRVAENTIAPGSLAAASLAELQSKAPIVLEPTFCLTSGSLTARPRPLRLSW